MDTEKAVDKISRQLLEHDVMTEGYGGQVPIIPVRENYTIDDRFLVFRGAVGRTVVTIEVCAARGAGC